MQKIDITPEELIILKECQKHHTKHNVRNRSRLLLLLNKGRTIPQISKIIDVRTRTIYTWLDNWELKGITALMTRKGQGLKSKLPPKEEKIVELVKKIKSMQEA